MAIVLMIKPAGLFGRSDEGRLAMSAVPELVGAGARTDSRTSASPSRRCSRSSSLAPLVAYPIFLMKVMCFALFACAFNLLIGYGGLLSFGHAMFLGTAGYASRARGQGVGLPAGIRDPVRHRARRRCSAW